METTKNMLSYEQFWALCNWMKDAEARLKNDSMHSASQKATANLWFPVTLYKIQKARDLTKLPLFPPRGSEIGKSRDRLPVLAGELIKVLDALGMPASDDLIFIAKRK